RRACERAALRGGETANVRRRIVKHAAQGFKAPRDAKRGRAAIAPRRGRRRLRWASARTPERADARRMAILHEMRIARQSQRKRCVPTFGIRDIEPARRPWPALARRVYDNEAGTQRNMNEARAALRRSRRKRGDLGEEKLADETLKQPELAHDLQARVAR